ncbi:MAG: uroporphyrinogen-III C-methyltransferase [Nitrococcus sp.]|nr:uroporphyrinogen-III C-methyltransferase [Nitrococcus sp.]
MGEEKTDKGRAHDAPASPGRSTPTQGGSLGGARSGSPTPKRDGGRGAPPARTGKGLAAFALLVALLVAAGAAGGGYWLWQQHQRLKAQHSQYLAADGVQSYLQPLKDQLAALSGEVQQLAQQPAGPSEQALARLDKTVDDLRQAQSQAQQRLAKLQQTNAELGQNAHEISQRLDDLAPAKRAVWAEAEAGYLAFVAENRLRFYGDVDSALAALKKADELLSELGGETIEARRGIARAVDSLLEVNRPARLEISHALGELVERLDDLPLEVGPRNEAGSLVPASAEAPASADASWKTRVADAWDELRGSLSKLVVVAHDQEVVPLVTPQEQFFLRQNLIHELETARFAAFRGDEALYKQSLGQVKDWLKTYFDTRDAAVSDTIDKISKLASEPVSVPLPDISPMLRPVKELGLRSAQ